ncbi:MAG: TAXI family TRAP transporter solute-binding subunit [Alphaproteobacteria bacterium]|nr:TAXI family TRAP transporter solute-binding subunit [Alphaproteobacteria bacterium]
MSRSRPTTLCAAAAVAVLAALAGLATSPVLAAERYITIGTGGDPGVYYPVGAAICRSVNAKRSQNGITCDVAPSGGSIENIAPLRDGTLEFAIVQSDWQRQAFEGAGRFADDGPFKDLRAVLALHLEAFTVLARADAGIAQFGHLIGRRFNVGNPGSGERATLEQILQSLNWSLTDFALATELKTSERGAALCSGTVDAIFFLTGHPSRAVSDTLAACDAVLVGGTAPEIDNVMATSPFYERVTLRSGVYPGADGSVNTFGVRATLVSAADVDEDLVYDVVRALHEPLEDFISGHQALLGLTAESMIGSGLSAPLHAGALKYYKERGWR